MRFSCLVPRLEAAAEIGVIVDQWHRDGAEFYLEEGLFFVEDRVEMASSGNCSR